MTGEAKQALALALAEARALRHDYIGTEHLLLGLLASAERTPRGDFTPVPCATSASTRVRPGSACSKKCGGATA